MLDRVCRDDCWLAEMFQVRKGLEKDRYNVPSDLLDDRANESSALAQVTLGAGNTGLGDTSSGLLFWGKE